MSSYVRNALSPVHTSNNVEATLSNATMANVASTMCGPGLSLHRIKRPSSFKNSLLLDGRLV